MRTPMKMMIAVTQIPSWPIMAISWSGECLALGIREVHEGFELVEQDRFPDNHQAEYHSGTQECRHDKIAKRLHHVVRYEQDTSLD